MDYLDTSFVIALSVKTDINHEVAVSFEKMIKDPVISDLVVGEVYVYFSRTLSNISTGVLEEYDFEEKVEAMAEYALKRSGARIVHVDVNELLGKVRYYAPKIRLKTLDLLHVLAANSIGASRIITLDRDFVKKSKLISMYLNIDVVSPIIEK